MSEQLGYVVYQSYPQTGAPTAIVGASPHIALPEGAPLLETVCLDPWPAPDAKLSQMVALVQHTPDQYLFASAYREGATEGDIYQFIFLPKETLYSLGGQLQPLLSLTDTPWIPDEAPPFLELPPPTTWTFDKQIAILRRLFNLIPNGDLLYLLSLLGAARHERQLLIYNFPPQLEQRLLLVQGLMMLLPATARPLLTFTTHSARLLPGAPRIIFSEAPLETNRWVVDWSQEPQPIADVLELPYIRWLASIWRDDVKNLVDGIRLMDTFASKVMAGHSLETGLRLLVERYQLDRQIERGEAIPRDEVLAVMRGGSQPQGELRRRYLLKLLEYALEERDTDAAQIVLREMDNDALLDTDFSQRLEADLEHQPDAVYAFIRSRLTDGLDERWLERLKQAARAALRVALTDGDATTIINWLKLIAREPATYGLSEVLKEAFAIAQKRAHTDPELALELTLLAIKRSPEQLETFLANARLTALLPPDLRAALCELDPVAINALSHDVGQKREWFLAAIARLMSANREISPPMVGALWALYRETPSVAVAEPYRPAVLMNRLIEKHLGQLAAPALEALMRYALASAEDNLFMTIIAHLAEHEDLFHLLANALAASEREVSDLITLINRLGSDSFLGPQQIINLYVSLMVAWDWAPTLGAMVEQLARLLHKNPDAHVSGGVLWKLLEIAAENKTETVAKVATRRLVALLQESEPRDMPALADSIATLQSLTHWNKDLYHTMLNALRELVRGLPLAQLQRLEKALDGKRALDEARAIVQTVIGLRKIVGQRPLDAFAEAISQTYTLLEAIASAFDPAGGRQNAIDTPTIYAELQERLDELSPEQRLVLAKNLKELAKLIATMAENRSKPSLIRSDDTLERQLYSGDTQPHSAIDVMKWLSGYLEKAQDSAEGGAG